MPAGSLRWMSLPGRWSSRHWDLEHFTWMLRRYYGFHSSAPRLAGLQCSSLIQRAHPGGFMTPNDESSMWIGRQARRPKCLWKALCTVGNVWHSTLPCMILLSHLLTVAPMWRPINHGRCSSPLSGSTMWLVESVSTCILRDLGSHIMSMTYPDFWQYGKFTTVFSIHHCIPGYACVYTYGVVGAVSWSSSINTSSRHEFSSDSYRLFTVLIEIRHTILHIAVVHWSRCVYQTGMPCLCCWHSVSRCY